MITPSEIRASGLPPDLIGQAIDAVRDRCRHEPADGARDAFMAQQGGVTGDMGRLDIVRITIAEAEFILRDYGVDEAHIHASIPPPGGKYVLVIFFKDDGLSVARIDVVTDQPRQEADREPR
jgi:hypothetical protein